LSTALPLDETFFEMAFKWIVMTDWMGSEMSYHFPFVIYFGGIPRSHEVPDWAGMAVTIVAHQKVPGASDVLLYDNVQNLVCFEAGQLITLTSSVGPWE
jgi:hypothetical protein